MRLGLIGLGKMGQMIAAMAPTRGHHVVASVRSDHRGWDTLLAADVCIEFTEPKGAVSNILRCAEMKKNIVVGTTGWYDAMPEVEKLGKEIGILYSPNFSVGVHLWMQMVRYGARLMKDFEAYLPRGVEVHHLEKKDAPSGTAKMMALAVQKEAGRQIESESRREGKVCGTHRLLYESSYDTITISHEAHNRTGFAEGALLAAEWLEGKKGVFTWEEMWKDVLPL